MQPHPASHSNRPRTTATTTTTTTTTPFLSRAAFAYSACFCEENVYLMLESLLGQPCQASSEPPLEPPTALADHFDLFAVFISNPTRSIPLWNHWDRSAKQPRTVCWDYHVIGVGRPKCQSHGQTAADFRATESIVLDLDTALAFPISFTEYALHALRVDLQLDTQFQRSFRVIAAKDFLSYFSSDRRHMRKPSSTSSNKASSDDARSTDADTTHGRSWIMPPPSYPPICGPHARSEHDLEAFIDMYAGHSDRVPGIVVNQEAFIDMFLNSGAGLGNEHWTTHE
ncbi:N-terminal glutamine amidase-domain-containing protein [Catenaria anguillulae PL171]|uniref:Protein N-terminal glutamine amidohydrolase n=1 Tax=Catenaria anguillulae PL171 TaxID=765915 RepID=A0A1Y2HSE3_9FUNG|nr:N-terminal glutamine amidase-domain-containing protein [Catenaria anguillulae PL171]